MFGSHWGLNTRYADKSDGESYLVAVEKPFYRLNAPWSFALTLEQDSQDINEYLLVFECFHRFAVYSRHLNGTFTIKCWTAGYTKGDVSAPNPVFEVIFIWHVWILHDLSDQFHFGIIPFEALVTSLF